MIVRRLLVPVIATCVVFGLTALARAAPPDRFQFPEEGSEVFDEQFTRVDGTDEFTHVLVGFRFMGTSPGEGLVLQDVGRIVYSAEEEEILFLAGQHHVPDPGGEAVFCAALA